MQHFVSQVWWKWATIWKSFCHFNPYTFISWLRIQSTISPVSSSLTLQTFQFITCPFIAGRGAEGKTKVIGAVQRGGKVVAQVVPDVKRHTLVPFMARKVSPNATLFTDEFPTYDTMVWLQT